MELSDLRSDAVPELLGNQIWPAPGQNDRRWHGDNAIFIGLGGLGVKTLNRMRAELQTRFAPGWENHVKFLALDSGAWELRRSVHLEPWEKMNVDSQELVGRMRNGEPIPETLKKMLSGREQEWELRDDTLMFLNSRLGSKLRLYAPDTAERYWDVEIVEKLRQLYREMAPSLRTWGDFERIKIFVIASLAGNFGSGAVTELPALVRRAVEDPKKLRICLEGIFYTPDLTAVLAQGDCDREMMFARGYAALKELKYYQGIRDRSGFCELFPSNDPEHPKWELGEKDGFYDHIYLVGGQSWNNEVKRVVDIAADWLLGEAYRSTSSLLELRYQIRKKRGAYLSRYDESWRAYGEPSPEEVVPEQEIVPHWMSLGGCFGTLNSVTADFDLDFFRAAVLGGICKKAGLSEETRYTASRGTAIARLIPEAELDTFRVVLKTLSGIYEAQYDLLMAEPVRERECMMPRLNLAQLHPASWEWYRRQVQNAVDAADVTAFLGGLAERFAGSSDKWMSVPENVAENSGGEYRLYSPERPVPARELFERYADDFMAGLPQPELTVKELLRVMEEQGISLEETVKLLIGKLRRRCAAQYTLDPQKCFAGELLHVAPGLKKEQIHTICTVGDALGLWVFLAKSDIDEMEEVPSGPENAFWLEAESLGMELGRIKALARWEEAYENQIHRFGSRLHGAPPKARMVKVTSRHT